MIGFLSRLRPALCGAVLFFAACGGGGGGGSDVEGQGPSFDHPTISPATAQWGVAGAQFVVSGGSRLEGSAFTATLGTTPCSSATVEATDPSKLDVVCDVPRGGPSSSLLLAILVGGKEVAGTSGQLRVALSWPPASGPVSFSSGVASSTATWWQENAPVHVAGGLNLPGHTLTALMDGVPCSAVALGSEEGTLEMKCSTRPGGPGTTALLVIQEGGVTVPGGSFSLDLAECADPGAPTSGVPLPQLCNAPAGTTAAASSGLEGVWEDSVLDVLTVFAPSGQFLGHDLSYAYGGQWTASGATWTPSTAERFSTTGSSAFTGGRALVPFTSVAGVGVDSYLRVNALAVSQTGTAGTVGVAGNWGASGDPLTLTVGSTGAFTGTTSGATFGTCALSGTLTVISAPKNMLAVAVTATGGSSCQLWKANQLTGLGFIDVLNVGTSSAPSYAYGLTYIVRSAGHAYFWATALRR